MMNASLPFVGSFYLAHKYLSNTILTDREMHILYSVEWTEIIMKQS